MSSAQSRRYRIHYDLAYDGGGHEWDGYYRFALTAKVALLWNKYIASWGGTATLYVEEATDD